MYVYELLFIAHWLQTIDRLSTILSIYLLALDANSFGYIFQCHLFFLLGHAITKKTSFKPLFYLILSQLVACTPPHNSSTAMALTVCGSPNTGQAAVVPVFRRVKVKIRARAKVSVEREAVVEASQTCVRSYFIIYEDHTLRIDCFTRLLP